MKSLRTMIVAFAVALFALPAAASAQSIYAGAGLTIPVGEYGDDDEVGADTGWLGVVGVTVDIGDAGLWAFGEGFYGQNNHSDTSPVPGKTNPYGAMGGLGYGFGDEGSVGFYVFGGAGLLVHKYSPDTGDSESDSNFGYEAGAGAGVPLSDAFGLWAEGRFMGASGTNFIGIIGGVSIDLGGGGGEGM